MVKVRSPNVCWSEQAQRLSDVLINVPTGAIGKMAGLPNQTNWEPVERVVKELMVKVGLRLAYDLQIVHKAKAGATTPDGYKALGQVFFGENFDPSDVQRQLEEAIGVKLTPSDIKALNVLVKLRQIATNRFAHKETIRRLPLMVASLGGKASNRASKEKASGPRERTRCFLWQEKDKVQSADSELTWKEILDSLTGDKVVTNWDIDQIYWNDENGKERVTSTGTFRNWKPKKS